jgi:hypothetical protein
VSPGRPKRFAVLVVMGVKAGRADDYARRFFQCSEIHTLQDVFEDAGEFTPAPGKQTGRLGVAGRMYDSLDLLMAAQAPAATDPLGPINCLSFVLGTNGQWQVLRYRSDRGSDYVA